MGPGRRQLLDREDPAGPGARRHAAPVLMSFLAEFWAFMRERKKYWMIPILVMMVILGGLVVLVQGSAVAPFIYTIF